MWTSILSSPAPASSPASCSSPSAAAGWVGLLGGVPAVSVFIGRADVRRHGRDWWGGFWTFLCWFVRFLCCFVFLFFFFVCFLCLFVFLVFYFFSVVVWGGRCCVFFFSFFCLFFWCVVFGLVCGLFVLVGEGGCLVGGVFLFWFLGVFERFLFFFFVSGVVGVASSFCSCPCSRSLLTVVLRLLACTCSADSYGDQPARVKTVKGLWGHQGQSMDFCELLSRAWASQRLSFELSEQVLCAGIGPVNPTDARQTMVPGRILRAVCEPARIFCQPLCIRATWPRTRGLFTGVVRQLPRPRVIQQRRQVHAEAGRASPILRPYQPPTGWGGRGMWGVGWWG